MNYTEREIIDNMRIAGFGESEIQEFLEKYRAGSRKPALQILGKHRSSLLEELHHIQDRISYTDYLEYRLSEGSEG